MQYRFEFVAYLNNGDKVHMVYKGETSRKNKVRVKILQDLKKMYNIEPSKVGEIFMKPYKNQTK